MKITKTKIKEIIREELERPLTLDTEGKLTWDHVEMPSNLHTRAESLWTHLNGLLKTWRPTEGESIQYKKDLFTLMDDYLRSPDRPSPGSPEPGLGEAKEKTKVTKPGQERVSKKIGHLIGKEKKDKDQAAAIAYSMEKRAELKKGGKHSVE